MAERGHSEGLCEYGKIILKWMLRKCIRMDFDYSCHSRALNNILMNLVITLTFHKFLRSLDKLSNHLASQEVLFSFHFIYYIP
jgi:hypothetical protein